MPLSPVPVFEATSEIPADASVIVVLKAGQQRLGQRADALDAATNGALTRACASPGFSGGNGECLDILAPASLSARRVIVLGLGEGAAVNALSAMRAGGALATHLEKEREGDAVIVFDTIEGSAIQPTELLARLALGMRLRRYRFDLRRQRKGAEAEAAWRIGFVGVSGQDLAPHMARIDAIAEGVELTRTLVNLPANHLHPDSFAEHLGPLRDAGVEIEVLEEAELKRLGMNALLAVGSASVHPPRVIALRYRGPASSDAPLAFVGKGICFDSGGLCAKNGPQMFDMKGDMAGAATVAGLILSLARQDSPVHVVGVLGIAENLPSGKAFKSGDIITTLSGQTVEVFDTDCEGRLLLADCLHYAATRFQPAAIVDLATLTYSVTRGLGKIFAGLFSNDDTIAAGLMAAGEAVGERFWRMPLDRAYDEELQSPFADLRHHAKDLEAGDAPYAAAFLRHFTEDRPWVHLDIAGQEFTEADRPYCRQGATGYGVQMLEEWVTRTKQL
jgi:leucyl aminopeptidase